MVEKNTSPSPGVAAVLSFVFSGMGQLYNGQLAKGLVLIFLSCVSILVVISGGLFIGFWLLGKASIPGQLGVGCLLFVAGTLCICILGMYSIIDAYRVALKK